MAHQYYPIALDVADKRCLVVGGGKIAADKVDGLLAAGASVTVVSPRILQRIADLAAENRIVHVDRIYEPADLDGVFLAYGATDDLQTNAQIADDARSRGVLVNAVDDPPNCDFFAVAVVRRGDLQVSISTNGLSPAFARWLREDLDASLPAEYGDLVAVLADVRREARDRGPLPPYEAWETALSDNVLSRLRQGDRTGVRRQIREAVFRVQDERAVAAGGPARWESA